MEDLSTCAALSGKRSTHSAAISCSSHRSRISSFVREIQHHVFVLQHAIIASLVHATSIVTIGGSSVAISGLATCYVSLVLAVIAVLILHSPQRAPSPMSRCNVASRLRPKVRTNRRTKKKHRKLWPETPRARQTCAWEQGGGGHDERLGQALLMIRGWCCQCRGQPC